MGRAHARPHVLGPPRPPRPSDGGPPAAPAHGGGAWARPIACAQVYIYIGIYSIYAYI